MQTKLKMHTIPEDASTASALFMKAVSYVAAFLGVGTFLGLVNLAVGVLSGVWLAAQLYGYFRYEIPYRRARLEAMRQGVAICETIQKSEQE